MKNILKTLLFGWLTDERYSRIAPYLLPLVSWHRYGHGCQVEGVKENIFEVVCDGKSWRYVGGRRIDRYLKPNGISEARKKMLKKYLPDHWSVGPGWTVIDVGANVGEFSVAMAEQNVVVYAFEPDPVVFECLVHNVESIEGLSVFPIQKAASDKDSEVEFYVSSPNADSSIVEPEVYDRLIKVQSVRLDRWMADMRIQKIDLIKVEAEGFEPEVLCGLRGSLTNVERVSVDAGPERRGYPTDSQVRDILVEEGFEVYQRGYIVYGEKNLN